MTGLSGIVLLVLGCSGEKVTRNNDTDQVGTEDTSAEVFETDWALEDIDLAVTDAILAMRWLDPVGILDMFDSLLEYGDESCPNASGNDGRYDIDCSTDDGSDFYLDLLYRRADGGMDGQEEVYEDAIFNGQGWVQAASGERADFAAYMKINDRLHSSGMRIIVGRHIGVAHWTGSDEGEWLADELSVTLDFGWYAEGDGTAGGAILSGGVSGIPAENDAFSGSVESVIFDDFVLGTSAMDIVCAIEPSGSLSLRTHSGEWATIEFTGPGIYGEIDSPLDCDGCGSVYVGGQELGVACPDFSALWDWEDRPW